MERYILDENGKPIEEPDLIAWGRWLKSNSLQRRVACDQIGDVKVSTVFLGLNHAFGEGPPVLWETLVFGGPRDGDGDRYTSREDAEAGHRR